MSRRDFPESVYQSTVIQWTFWKNTTILIGYVSGWSTAPINKNEREETEGLRAHTIPLFVKIDFKFLGSHLLHCIALCFVAIQDWYGPRLLRTWLKPSTSQQGYQEWEPVFGSRTAPSCGHPSSNWCYMTHGEIQVSVWTPQAAAERDWALSIPRDRTRWCYR